MSIARRLVTGILLLCGTAFVSGCMERSSTVPSAPGATAGSSDSSNPSDSSATAKSAAGSTATEHGHQSGDHGGIMISLGRDSYHVEAVFEKGGVLRLYTLGQDESRVIDVERQSLKGFVKVEGGAEAQPFMLESEPQPGDADGRTSQFAGPLPKGLWGLNLEVTVPNIVISGERFRLGFKSTAEQHDAGMPNAVAEDEEQQLFLTPGGLYTAKDIELNGKTTASLKFKGLRSSHDMSPQPGDKICPITRTKANPQFTWVVDGKSYEFCCPPCVEEFVKVAKTAPDEIKPPSTYVK